MSRRTHVGAVTYYGSPLAAILTVVGVFLFGSSRVSVNLVIIAIGATICAEGLALLVDWLGSATDFSRRLQKNPDAVIAFLTPTLVRTMIGGGLLAWGAVVIYGGAVRL